MVLINNLVAFQMSDEAKVATHFEEFFFQSALRVYINITSDVDLYCTLKKNRHEVKFLAPCFHLKDGIFKWYYSLLN